MLKNREGLLLTEEECDLIDQINLDNANGRHLLDGRSQDYWNMRVAIEQARLHRLTGTATEKEKQLAEYQKQGSNYSYWEGLPDEEKLFYEEDD